MISAYMLNASGELTTGDIAGIMGTIEPDSYGRSSPCLIEIGGLDEISAYVIMTEGLMAPQPIHGIDGVAELSYGNTLSEHRI